MMNWNEHIPQIPPEWKSTKGKGVNIAILDTGVYYDHPDLQKAITSYEDFTVVPDKIDYIGHGTHITGLVGARSSLKTGITGVAPQSQLICLKVLPDSKDGDLKDYQCILDALNFAVLKGADVINLSLSLNLAISPGSVSADQLMITALRNKITEIGKKNIIMVAAAGDNADLRNGKLFFPAECPEIISVASIKEGYIKANPDYSRSLNVVGPTINYLSTYIPPSNYEKCAGCSMTSAFISGIVALAIAANRKKGVPRLSKKEVLLQLGAFSLNVEDINYFDEKNFYYSILNMQ
jgi:subtilisin family serine protease